MVSVVDAGALGFRPRFLVSPIGICPSGDLGFQIRDFDMKIVNSGLWGMGFFAFGFFETEAIT